MLISENVFRLLKKKNMRQKDFSELTGISQSTISDWKRKKTNPSADKILKICEVLQVTPYELLSETVSDNLSPESDYRIVLGQDETILVETFRKLDMKRRQRLLGYMEALADKEI